MAEKPTRTTAAATNISLEASKADKHIWLMKCPPIVSRVLHSAPPPPLPPPPDTDSSALPSDRPVAKVIVAVDLLLTKESNDDFASTQFTMELAGTGPGNIPKCYSMDMSTDFIPMSIFSESVQGRLSVEGKIYHKFDMKPHNENIENYGKLCRERTNKYMTKSRQIQEKKKAPTKGSELKRTRRDRDEMEEIMFKLFEKQPNWTLKQLIQETDQPEQFLKDMLKLLCVYNNKGTNQGTYELKPEYKRSEDS